MRPQNVFYGANVGDVPNVNMQVLGHQRLMTTQVQPYSPNVIQPQGQIASGIDPRYLAAYSDDNIPAYAQHSTPQPMAFNTFVDIKKKIDNDLLKSEQPNQVKTRAEKLKELQKSGGRVFSGPVEKILKWHKSLQDIGIMVMYEIVGKCVNVRAGEACAKNLVVRDDNGPAIQVVYYEIDFFLPELKPPCTVRVIGRMMPGTNRFQAFNVRLATGDDVATLPRRAAVAAHHVAKLCKEYGVEVLVFK
ncbi:uncharacterized protein LOC112050598 [Bicyclus anynana]|uniref:Uncharacterized protein LOC112050598 n=1 Tax=Bicyclus anynana TaxID=110368 RepID=A0ABM3LR02_BICAN|nr:uncharacterized protein LOC112050598 [Bicyclus anynana]